MLTRGNWFIIHIKINRFRLWLPLPVYVLRELLWQVVELGDLVGTFGNEKLREYKKALPTVIYAIDSICEGGRYDLVDIDVSDDEQVKVKIKVR